MPGCGQPRLPSGNVTCSAEMTVTWSAGTPASLATSATTGSITDVGRSMFPEGFTCDGWTLAGVSDPGPSDVDAAEQPPTTQTAASSVKLTMRIPGWYAERAPRRVSARGRPGPAFARGRSRRPAPRPGAWCCRVPGGRSPPYREAAPRRAPGAGPPG